MYKKKKKKKLNATSVLFPGQDQIKPLNHLVPQCIQSIINAVALRN